MPIDGFVLSVDGKLKKRYDTSEEAMTAGSKLKQDFPVVQVAVYDASERVYTPVAGAGESGAGRVPRLNGAFSEGR